MIDQSSQKLNYAFPVGWCHLSQRIFCLPVCYKTQSPLSQSVNQLLWTWNFLFQNSPISWPLTSAKLNVHWLVGRMLKSALTNQTIPHLWVNYIKVVLSISMAGQLSLSAEVYWVALRSRSELPASIISSIYFTSVHSYLFSDQNNNFWSPIQGWKYLLDKLSIQEKATHNTKPKAWPVWYLNQTQTYLCY